MLDWYHLYLNHPGKSRLCETQSGKYDTVKASSRRSDLYAKPQNKFQRFQNRRTLYGHLTTKILAELRPQDLVHADLIGPYIKSIIQQHTGNTTIKIYFSLTCMAMIDPATSWFEIVDITTFNLNEVMGGNSEYIDKSSARVIQVFNNTRISIYPLPRKVVC